MMAIVTNFNSPGSFFADMGADEMEQWGGGAFGYSERVFEVEKVRGEYERMFLGG